MARITAPALLSGTHDCRAATKAPCTSAAQSSLTRSHPTDVSRRARRAPHPTPFDAPRQRGVRRFAPALGHPPAVVEIRVGHVVMPCDVQLANRRAISVHRPSVGDVEQTPHRMPACGEKGRNGEKTRRRKHAEVFAYGQQLTYFWVTLNG